MGSTSIIGEERVNLIALREGKKKKFPGRGGGLFQIEEAASQIKILSRAQSTSTQNGHATAPRLLASSPRTFPIQPYHNTRGRFSHALKTFSLLVTHQNPCTFVLGPELSLIQRAPFKFACTWCMSEWETPSHSYRHFPRE